MISAKIIADSVNEHSGDRITSMVVTFPRIVLAEAKTHRIISGLHEQVEVSEGFNDFDDSSKNSASSRAIPIKRMLKMVKENPFIPVEWQKEHSGMQGTEYLEENLRKYAERDWLEARDNAIKSAHHFHANGITKQLANRLLEPFMWHTAIITATEWDNFFNLRCPQYKFWYESENENQVPVICKSWKDLCKHPKQHSSLHYEKYSNDVLYKLGMNIGQAEIHISLLAEAMWDALNESNPKTLKPGEWHIPFGDQIDKSKIEDTLYKLSSGKVPILGVDLEQAKLEIATARCARVSYLNYEGKDDYESDFRLFKVLKDSGHFSPFEHCAKVMSEPEYVRNTKNFTVLKDGHLETIIERGWCKNFRGFTQLRALIEQ